MRSEIYALGCIVFQALAGVLPYEGETMPEIFYARLGGSSLRVETFVSPLRKTTAQVVDRMLAIGPGQRFQTWEETLEALTGALGTLSQSGSPVAARPRVVAVARVAEKPPVYSAARGAWFTIAMLLAIVGFAGWFGWRHWHAPELSAAPIAIAAPEAPAIPEPPAAAPPKPATPADTKPAPKVAAPPPVAATAEKPTLPQPEHPKKDWNGWEVSILKSLKNKVAGSVQGDAHPIPGTNEMRVSGNNSGIAGHHDECVFYSRTLSGDWTLTARIVSNTGIAALCARAPLGKERSGQPCVAVLVSGDGKVSSAVRLESEKPADVKPLPSASRPAWLQLTRRGAKLTAFYAMKKGEWIEAAALALPALPPNVDAGLMVWSTAKDTKEKAAATFDEVSWSPVP